MDSKDLEEGPLSDNSQDEQKGKVTGLPLEYLLGEASTRSEQHFYNLQAEETLSSLENTEISPPQASSTIANEKSQLKERKQNLKLDIDPEMKSTTGLLFSPGGSEAYVFSTAGIAELQGASKKLPRGERPKPMGHEKPRPKIDRNALQGRLESLRTSLDFELEEQTSTEPSPRRYLPRVPSGDEVELSSPSVTRRGAQSPSIASVASGSTTASGTDPRRRNLEWDSGADLGYEDIVRQKEAAATLSTLEKLAIGNYSNFLRTEPEGTSNKVKGQQQILNRLPGGQDHEDDLRQMRLHKFADSLMKQRQLNQQTGAKTETKTLETEKAAKKSDSVSESSPVRRKLKKKSSPRKSKSSSLTDLTQNKQIDRISVTHSASDLSPRSLDPSSSSSGATVIAHKEDDEIDPKILEVMAANFPKQSLTSLNSRQSVETVITLEQLLARQQRQQQRKNTQESSDLSLDTDDEIQMIRDQEKRNDAEGREERPRIVPKSRLNNWLRDENSRAQSLPPLPKEASKNSKKKRQPQDLTTSEDERQKASDKRSGTLDSAPIDRVKSFEYFPGESFPLQENSSSYEYLPGHMIHDTRPPTVVSNRPEGGSSSSNLSPTTSPSVQSTSSNAVQSCKRVKKTRNLDPAKLAYHLMEKSNQLHSAHVHQTMAFYSRLKEYISYISTPSQRPADARVKQQMADKILELMRQEEVKLTEKRPVSCILELSPDFLDEDTTAEEPTTQKIDEIDTKSATADDTQNPEESSYLADSNDLSIQRMRIGQMKKLRKEIRKLEKLEKIRLKKAESNGRESKILTEAEILKKIMVMSDDSSISTQSSTFQEPKKIRNFRGVEGQSASGSDNKNKPLVKKPSVSQVKEFCSGNNQKKDAKTNTYQQINADFGQTFPTPRISGETVPKQRKAAPQNRSNNKPKELKKPPLTYSIPSKENYAKSPEISLSEALKIKKPDFLTRSKLRVEVLNQIREARLIQSQKYKEWYEEVCKLPKNARHLLPAPPKMPKIPRLFNHREMIRETREKYYKLPEIIYSKAVAKRKSSYTTNRLKAEMYKKKLQRKVLQGRVSLACHNQILE